MAVTRNLLIMLLGGVIVFGVIFFLWNQAHAAEEAQPKWKIVITMDGPPGKHELTYGDAEHGPHWYATLDECDKARKGGDVKLAYGLKILREQVKQTKMPIEVKVECKPDNSV